MKGGRIAARFNDAGMLATSSGAPARIGVLGGTFDPIHLGHLSMAERAREACALDAVLFVPAGDPVFKRGAVEASAHDRLEMTARAVSSNLRFDVCALEVERAGASYMVDTLEELKAHFGDAAELFLIVGSDVAATLWKWRASARIAALVHLIVVARPGGDAKDAVRASIDRAGEFAVAWVDAPAFGISSSAVRARVAAGMSVRYLVPDQVAAYISAHGLYGCPAVSGSGDGAAVCNGSNLDSSSETFYCARRADLADRVGKHRARHIDGVAETAEGIANLYGLDADRARLAGLLHDWDKGLDDERIRQRVFAVGAEVDPWVFDHMPWLLHGPTAAAALGQAFPGIPADVLSAIERHTAGAVDMSSLDMCIYVADAIEPGRTWPGVESVRAVVGKVSLEELFFETLRRTFAYLVESGRMCHPITVEVWNAYAARVRAAKGKATCARGGKERSD